MNLLVKLLHVIEETVQAWDVFRSSDGDSGYFSDIGPTADERRNNLKILHAINERFELLRAVHRRLKSSQDRCQRMAQNVS